MRRTRDLSTFKKIILLALTPAVMTLALLSCVDVIPYKGPINAIGAIFWIVLTLIFFLFSQAVMVACFGVYEICRMSINFLRKKSDDHRPMLRAYN